MLYIKPTQFQNPLTMNNGNGKLIQCQKLQDPDTNKE